MRRGSPLYFAVWMSLLLLSAAAILWATPDEHTRRLFFNTLRLSAEVAALSLPIGAIAALLISRTDVPLGRLAGAVFLGMLFVPLYVQAAGWDAGFGMQGWWPLAFGSIEDPPLKGWRGAVAVHALTAIPWVTLIVATALRHIPPEWEESALLDASPLRVLFRVTLPCATMALVTSVIWIVVLVSGEVAVTDLYQVNTVAREVFVGFALDELEMAHIGLAPSMAALAWVTAAALVLVWHLAPRTSFVTQRRSVHLPLGRLRWPLGALLLGIVLLVAATPLVSLIYNAGVGVEQIDGERVRFWSLRKTAAIVAQSPWRFRREIRWTLLIGAAAATAAMAIAVPLAWRARKSRWAAATVVLLTSIVLAIPGPVIGLSIIWLLNRRDWPILSTLYDRSILAPTMAITLRALPLTVLVCWHVLRSVSPIQEDSASIDGAGPLTRLIYIVIPQRLPALAGAWMIALAFATADLAASYLVMPPGVDSLSRRIFGLIHAGVNDQVAGICLTCAAGALGGALLTMALFRRSRRG